MLVLKRKMNQDILIGDDIVVKVVGVKGGNVLVGIEAPRHVLVDRPETREKRDADRAAGEGGGRC